MKKSGIILLFLIVMFLFIVFVSASNVGLIESVQWESNLTGVRFSATAFGDVDNDGDLDLAIIGCLVDGGSECGEGVIAKIYINNGTTLTESQIWQENLTAVGWGALAWGDVNNDGDLDLVLSGCVNTTSSSGLSCTSGITISKIYINNGSSLIENSTWQENLTQVFNPSISLGDIDNDGDLDIAITGSDNSEEISKIYINNGTTFTENLIWQNELTGVIEGQIVLGDIDNDGDLDLALTGDKGSATDFTSFYINNGTTFVESSQWSNDLTFMDRSSLLFGNYNNDQYLDLMLCGHSNIDECQLYKNNGSTLLLNQTSAEFFSGIYRASISFGDYDNDGDLDLIQIGHESGRALVSENNESNNYSFQEDTLAHANISDDFYQGSVVWGDVDNDGDLDLIITGFGVGIVSNVYINNITTPNNAPTPPANFSSSYNNRELKLGWGNGSDTETISTGLYYNLMIGNASINHTIISGIYGGSSGGGGGSGGGAGGYFGNMMQRKNFTLKVDRLEPSTTYNWYVQTIDTGLKAGNWSSVQSFTTPLDMEKPVVTLNSPVEGANSSSYTITFNVSISENLNLTNVSLYGNWTGSFAINQTNSSGFNNTDYIFTADLTGYSDGNYIWMIQAKDNATNVQNSSIRTFTLDTTIPSIAISFPTNNTNTSDSGLEINYTVSDLGVGLQACWYSNDSYALNITITCGNNITTITWSEGQHNVTVWANDSVGNENITDVTFTIDTISPDTLISFPSNNTNTTNTGLEINYTVSDLGVGLQACWYSNDSYGINTTITCGNNITTITWSEGEHNVTVWANDSVGNDNSSSVTFTIDTTSPSVAIVSPLNNTNTSNNLINVSYTVSDSGVGLQSCWYSNDSFSINITITCGTNITTLNWSDETTHNITIYANDTLGNEGQSSVVFTVNTTDVTSPNITLLSPDNGASHTSNSQEILFSYNISEKNEISTCSLIIDGNIDLTNSSVNKLITQNFTQTFTPASYNWNINCTDGNNNIGNSSVRDFTVTAPVSPPGGGGGSSSSITITPKEFDIDFSNTTTGTLKAKQGDIKTFTFNGQITHKITISEVIGNSVKLIIESEPIILVLSVGEIKQIDINKDNINDFEIRLISIINGKASLSLNKLEGADIVAKEEIEEAARKKALFDVKISILEKFKKVLPGEEVTAQIEVLNINNIGQVDVVVDYYLSDNETMFAEASDTLAVEAVASFVRSLIVPEDTKAGTYFFGVDITYNNILETSSKAEFKVKSKTINFIQERFKEIIIIVIILIGIILFVYLKMIRRKEIKDILGLRRKEKKMEKEIKKLKRK